MKRHERDPYKKRLFLPPPDWAKVRPTGRSNFLKLGCSSCSRARPGDVSPETRPTGRGQNDRAVFKSSYSMLSRPTGRHFALPGGIQALYTRLTRAL